MKTKFIPANNNQRIQTLAQLHLTAENAVERAFLEAAFRHDIEFMSSELHEANTLVVSYKPKSSKSSDK